MLRSELSLTWLLLYQSGLNVPLQRDPEIWSHVAHHLARGEHHSLRDERRVDVAHCLLCQGVLPHLHVLAALEEHALLDRDHLALESPHRLHVPDDSLLCGVHAALELRYVAL